MCRRGEWQHGHIDRRGWRELFVTHPPRRPGTAALLSFRDNIEASAIAKEELLHLEAGEVALCSGSLQGQTELQQPQPQHRL